MLRTLICVAPILIAGVVLSGPATAQPPDHPRMRAALHELREARAELKESKDPKGGWPAGYKDRALEAINDAIESLRVNLAIREADTLKGVERNPDFYTKFKDHPRLRAAILDLRQARLELESNLGNLREPKDRELRERALDDIDIALGHILVLVRERKK